MTTTTTALGIGHTHEVHINGELAGYVHRLTSGSWTARYINDHGAEIGLPSMFGDTFETAIARIETAPNVTIADMTHQCGRCSADVAIRLDWTDSLRPKVTWVGTDGLTTCSDGEPHAVDRMHRG